MQILYIQNLYSNKWQSYFSIDDNPKYKENFSNFEYVNPEAPQGGAIRHAIIGNFNQFTIYSNFLPINALVFDTLMRKAADEIASYYPLIAKKLLITNDGVIFTIDNRARFNNDEKITAQDIKYSFDLYIKYIKDLNSVSKIIIQDDYHLKFYITGENFSQTISEILKIPIISHNFQIKNQNIDFKNDNLPLFSGPYVIKNFQLGAFIHYQKNKNYWGRNLPCNLGRFNFDKVLVNFYQNSHVAAFAINNNKSDIIVEFNSKNWHSSYNKHSSKLKKYLISQKNVPRITKLFLMNQKNLFLQNKNIRQALFTLFNRSKIIEKFFNNDYQIKNSLFFNNNHSIENNDDEQRIQQALNILNNANYKINKISNHKSPMKLKIISYNVNHQIFIREWIRNMQKIGIDAEVFIYDFPEYISKLKNGDYDIAHYSFYFNEILDQDVFDYFHSNGKKNFSYINDVFLDNKISQMLQTLDLPTKNHLLQIIDNYIIKNYLVITQWDSDKLKIVMWDKFKYPMPDKINNIDYMRYGFDTWWYNQ